MGLSDYNRSILPASPSEMIRTSVLELRREGYEEASHELETLQLAVEELERENEAFQEEEADDTRVLDEMCRTLRDALASLHNDASYHDADKEPEDLLRELIDYAEKMKAGAAETAKALKQTLEQVQELAQ